MIKAILFDCFGVMLSNAYTQRITDLKQSQPDAAQRVKDISRAADKGLVSIEEARVVVAEEFGVSSDELIELERVGEQRNVELLAYAESLKPTYKVAMLSNIGNRARLDIRFLPGELDRVFDLVIASGDVGYIKPEPEVYELTARQLGVLPEECLMVDDVQLFCEGAEAVGMKSVQFISNQQAMRDVSLMIDEASQTA